MAGMGVPCPAKPCPGHPGTQSIVPSSFATSAIRLHHTQAPEQMSPVISQRLSFFILTPGKNV